MNAKVAFVLAISFSAIAILYAIEQFAGASYVVKTSLKVLLLLVIPLLASFLLMRERMTGILGLRGFRLRSIIPGVAFGAFSFAVILAAYAMLGRFIDFSAIVFNLETKLGITPANFLFVGLYVIFVNSLLEEFFFRGFLFLNLRKQVPAWFAYVFSAGLFAVYHVAIIKGWFNPALMALALLSLFTVGFIFNFLNAKSGHFLNSWIAHAIADSAIILIGLRMFGMI